MAVDRDATLKSAEKLLRQGKIDAAIGAYTRLASAHPDDWTSLNALGDLYVRAGQPHRAVPYFARVADRLLAEGALPKAAAVYRKIQRVSPSDPRAARGLAAIATRQAGAAAARSTAIPPDDPDARVNAARQALDGGDVQRGSDLLVEAAALYAARKRPWDAVAVVAEATDADPSNHDLRQRLIRMLIEQGEIMQARYTARFVPEMLIVAEALEAAGRRAEALDLTAEAAALDPDNMGLRHRVLTEFVGSGEIERARALARSVSELQVVAEALSRDGRAAEVLEVIGEAVQQAPTNAPLREQFIAACVQTGAFDRARQSARSARDWSVIADGLGAAGRAAERIDALREATGREPHNAALHGALVRACLESGDVEAGRAAARTTAELLEVADALDARGDAQSARDVRAEALRRDPDDPALRARLLNEYLDSGDIDRARWLGRDAGELLEIARLLQERGRGADALDFRLAALERAPADRQLRLSVAEECLAAGDLDRAARAVTAEHAGDDPELLNALALVELESGRINEGRRAVARMLALDASRRGDVLALALRLADGQRGEAGFVCVDLFADAAMRAGEPEAAAAGLQEFAARVPNHVPALLKLVEVCVDGSLPALPLAQILLADAYVAGRRGREARVIAEDLFMREPWEQEHVERLRRVLALTGAEDQDAIMADLLSSESPVSLEDL